MEYLKRVKRIKNIVPSFWMSQTYFEKAGFKEEETKKTLWVVDEDGNVMFPGMTKSGPTTKGVNEIWALSEVPPKGTLKFLDYNFFYSPTNFNNLSGKKWKVFRQNLNKFNRFTEELKKEYRELNDDEKNDLMKVFLSWLEADQERIFEGGEIVLAYLEEPPKTVKGLFINGNLEGFNIWDENHRFINFRYCFNNPIIPSINHQLRYLFYTDPEIQAKNKWVNDGGCLDRQRLRFFKDHLNPVNIIKHYTWRR